MSNTDKSPIIYWTPTNDPQHIEEYRKLFLSWFPQHDMSIDQFRAERAYVQEQVEAKAAASGVPFVLVKATPRWIRQQVLRFGWVFTQEAALKIVHMTASMPGFDANKVYDIDE